LPFKRVSGAGVLELAIWYTGYRPLLQSMRELMGEQARANSSVRMVLAAAEDNVLTKGIGARVDDPCGSRCRIVRMHAHVAEIMAETWFHEGADAPVQWLARRTQHLLHSALHHLLGGTICFLFVCVSRLVNR
jgi:hypothetical protein